MALIRAVLAFLATSMAASVSATGILLPLYIYPAIKDRDGAANWKPAFDAITASPNVPWLVAVRLRNGPGSAPGNGDLNYYAGMRKLNAFNNTQTLGHVRLDYGDLPRAFVNADVTDWANWEVDRIGVYGIFFDEAKGADFAYLSAVIADARRIFDRYRFVYEVNSGKPADKLQFTFVCNFGEAVDERFYKICDVVLVFDGYLNNPRSPAYEGTLTIGANTPDSRYIPQAAVLVRQFGGSDSENRPVNAELVRTYVNDAKGAKLGWLYFSSAEEDYSITMAPVTVGALAAAFDNSP